MPDVEVSAPRVLDQYPVLVYAVCLDAGAGKDVEPFAATAPNVEHWPTAVECDDLGEIRLEARPDRFVRAPKSVVKSQRHAIPSRGGRGQSLRRRRTG